MKKHRQTRHPMRPPRSRSHLQDKFFTGSVQKNPRGFAFILSEDPHVKDTFVSPPEARALLNGDFVQFKVRYDRGRASATITKIIHRSAKRLVGRVEKGHKGMEFLSLDGDSFRVQGDAKPGWALVSIEHFSSPTRMGSVKVLSFLGKELHPSHDPLLAITRFNLHSEFSENILKEAKNMAEPRGGGHRKDLTSLPFVTIDGEDAKDFDDAICVLPGKFPEAFILYVAIADVSHYVKPGSLLDKEASQRGTSVYFPGAVIPMLPEFLSNELCSLKPQQLRYAFVAEIHLDTNGAVLKTHFYETVIRTQHRLTYTTVQEYMNGNKRVKQALEDVSLSLDTAVHLYRQLGHNRKKRGVLDFDLPECKIEVDSNGVPVSIKKAPRYDSHRLIEEFMICANREVAFALKKAQLPSLYRTHDPPDGATIESLNQLLKRLGISQKVSELTPKALSRILELTSEHEGHRTIHQSILRLQKQAKYSTSPDGHFGLALADYTHFTSPIRRYPDLVVHRSLKTLIRGRDLADNENEKPEILAKQTSDSERRAMEAERYLAKRKQAWFMLNHLGESFEGIISGVTAAGLFVELSETAIEGFIRIASLGGSFEFDEEHMCLRRRGLAKPFSLGNSIRIRVVDVVMKENSILFEPAQKT